MKFLKLLAAMLRLPYMLHLQTQLKDARSKSNNRLREIHQLRSRLIAATYGHKASLVRGTEEQRWLQERVAVRLAEQEGCHNG